MWQTTSTSLESTARLAEAIGSRLKGGEIIELVSDLGGGKTTFVRGLAKGAGSIDKVASPSFTLSREYNVTGRTFHKIVHFDFYRLNEPGIVARELAEIVHDKEVVVVEWADIVENVLPAGRLVIRIVTIGETEREFKFTYPAALQYLIPQES